MTLDSIRKQVEEVMASRAQFETELALCHTIRVLLGALEISVFNDPDNAEIDESMNEYLNEAEFRLTEASKEGR